MDAVWAEMPVETEYWIGGEYDYTGDTGFIPTSGMNRKKIILNKINQRISLISANNTLIGVF